MQTAAALAGTIVDALRRARPPFVGRRRSSDLEAPAWEDAHTPPPDAPFRQDRLAVLLRGLADLRRSDARRRQARARVEAEAAARLRALIEQISAAPAHEASFTAPPFPSAYSQSLSGVWLETRHGLALARTRAFERAGGHITDNFDHQRAVAALGPRTAATLQASEGWPAPGDAAREHAALMRLIARRGWRRPGQGT